MGVVGPSVPTPSRSLARLETLRRVALIEASGEAHLLPHRQVVQASVLPNDRARRVQRAMEQAAVLVAPRGHDANGVVTLAAGEVRRLDLFDTAVRRAARAIGAPCASTPRLPGRIIDAGCGAADIAATVGDVALAQLDEFPLGEEVTVSDPLRPGGQRRLRPRRSEVGSEREREHWCRGGRRRS